jgi:maleate isomerase
MIIETIKHRQPLENLAPVGCIGVIALATDFNIETDLRRVYPEGTEIFTTRVRNTNPLTIENLRTMAPHISAAADTLLPGFKLDAIIYACTSGTIAIGVEQVTKLVQKACPDVAVINPVSAALAAFEKLSVHKKISILTPYSKDVNKEVAVFFDKNGYEVSSMAGFGFEDDTSMTFIATEDIVDAAVEMFDPSADLLFISCTALRASVVIEQIEQRIGKPVLSTNQVLAWHSLQALGYDLPIKGFGSLMEQQRCQ